MKRQTAEVWVGAKGRRYFTKAAAASSLARHAYRTKYPCECERPDGSYPGYMCPDCRDSRRMDSVVSRLARFLRRSKEATR